MSDELQKQMAVDTHSEQAELFASRYDVIKESPYQNCFTYSRLRLNHLLDKYLPESGDGLKLLDVGCGTGYHLARYKERGFDITGVDGSPEMLKQARLANPEIDFQQCDVDHIPLADNSYEVVMCIEVLRYLPDISPCLKEISRLLKPNGIALITASPILQASLYPLINKLTSSRQVGKYTNLKQFFHSQGELQTKFKEAGFGKVEVHGVYGGSINWVEQVAPPVMPPLLRVWEKIDSVTADAPVLKNFANMFLVYART